MLVSEHIVIQQLRIFWWRPAQVQGVERTFVQCTWTTQHWQSENAEMDGALQEAGDDDIVRVMAGKKLQDEYLSHLHRTGSSTTAKASTSSP